MLLGMLWYTTVDLPIVETTLTCIKMGMVPEAAVLLLKGMQLHVYGLLSCWRKCLEDTLLLWLSAVRRSKYQSGQGHLLSWYTLLSLKGFGCWCGVQPTP